MKKVIVILIFLVALIAFGPMFKSQVNEDFLFFKINEGYLKDAYELVSENHGDFVDSFAKVIYFAGDMKEYKSTKDLVKNSTLTEGDVSDLKKMFSCVLNGMVGSYEYKTISESSGDSQGYDYNLDGTKKLNPDGTPVIKTYKTKVKTDTWNSAWGVKLRYPFAEGVKVSRSDDYGNARTYGGNRTHEGNDLIVDKGTPIINIESGFLKRIGWSNYGGWNVIIESLDGKRRYYYAHMLKFANYKTLNQKIEAGQIIGYVGDSGYGSEGTTGQFIAHLHLQIEVKYDDVNELINIDPYTFLNFIESYKVKTIDENNDGVLEIEPNTEIRVNN